MLAIGAAILEVRVRYAMRGQFARFLLTSGTAALVNLIVRYKINLVMPYEAAVALAFPFGPT